MADGVERNKKTDDGNSHPFAVDEPRSAFSIVSKGHFKPTTTHLTKNEAFQPQQNIDGVHEPPTSQAVRNINGRSSNIHDNALNVPCNIDGSAQRSNRRHDVISHGGRIPAPIQAPVRTTDLTNNNTVSFLETPIVKPIRRVNIKEDAIGPGVLFESRGSSECRDMPHPNSVHDKVHGTLRNRGGRRHEASSSLRNENMRYSNQDSGHEHFNVSNSNYSSALSERRSNFANSHRLANDLELLSRPSWCDATFALDQIVQGKATGNKKAVGFRSVLHRYLFRLGCLIQRRAGVVLIVSLMLLMACAVGLKERELETRVEKLWVESGGVLEDELEYTKKSFGDKIGAMSTLLLIQVGQDTASIPSLQLHLQAALAASKVTVTAYEQNWGLSDLCHKDVPDLGEVNGVIESIITKIFPCLIIGPLDCFYEGAELLGPQTPTQSVTYSGSQTGSLSWKTIDPIELVDMFSNSKALDMKKFTEMIISAGVNHGYQDRWCLDPNNPECPRLAPNKNTKEAPDVKKLFTKGCDGYATKYMKWPNDLIVGGTEKNEEGNITRVRGLQTLFHLMGPTTMYNFHKDSFKVNNWSLEKAKNIITQWERKFVQEMYKVQINSSSFDSEPDQIHAFAPSTAEDLILEFSNFSIVRVAGGYILMIVYACLTMLRCKASRSQGTVGIVGVLLVALSVMAGLGICSVLQIKFNAATTQVLPFLMLGLGVDDMFLIAHQFGEITCLSFIHFEERTGECLKRVGVSVVLTSVAIISGFLFSMVIPMPALRSFAMQAAIVTCFNLLCVLVVFPAALSLDLQRRKNNRLDFFCCFLSSSANDVVELSDYGHDVPPPRRGQVPDVRFAPPPPRVEVHHPGMQNGTTFTMHQTIQAFSNDSYVTFLSPRPETLYNPNNVTVNVIHPDNTHFQPTPLTPPPGYTAEDESTKVSTPEPPAAPRLAFQDPPSRVPLQTTRQQSTQKQKTTSRPHSSSRSTVRPSSSSRIHRSATSNLVTPMESVRSSTHSLVPVKKRHSLNLLCCKGKNAEYSQRMPFITLGAFAKKYYAPFLMKKPVKITVLVICCLLLGGSIYGCTIVRDGLDFVDIFPRDSREHSALTAQVKYFSFYNMYLVSKEFDYAHKQRELHMLHQNMSDLKFVVRNTDGTRTTFWLERMRDWLQNLMDAFDNDWSLGHINETTWNPRASEDGKLAFILLTQTGKLEDPTNYGRIGCAPPFSRPCPKVNIVRLVSDDGIIREDAFYNYLTAWSQHDQLAYVASQAEIKPTPSTYDEDLRKSNFIITRSKAITYAQMPYYLNGLRENDDFVNVIKTVRSLCNHYEMQGVLIYPSGYPFLLWQQYIDLRQWLFVALGAAIFAISAVVSLALLNLWAGGITCFFLVMISTEVLGFMGLVGVKLSAVPAVILISVVGLGVEFTVHITLAFVTSCGSREDRAKAAVSHMMGPVLDGAISTFLGVVMLSGSEFDFIIRYFFQVLAIMVVIGVWNGIVILPVVLSMIGPRPEIEPCGGGSRLKTPTPPPTPPMEEEENVCPNCSNGRISRLNNSYARYSSRDDVSYMQRPYTGESVQMRAPYYPSYRNPPQRGHHPMDPRLQCQVNPGYSHPPSNGSSGSCTPRMAFTDGRVYLYQPDVVLYSQRRPEQLHAHHCDSSVRGSPMEATNSSNRVDQRVEVGDNTRGASNHRAQPIATVTSSFTLKVLHPKHQQFPVHLAPSSNAGKNTPTNDLTKFQPIPVSSTARPIPSYQESLRNISTKRTQRSTRISPNIDQPSEEVDSAFSQLGCDNIIQ